MTPTFDLSDVEAPSIRKDTRVWSSHQQAVFAAVEDPAGGNLRVDAVAGSGKTTTLVEACSRMSGDVAFCAFNKRIADEIKERVSGYHNVKAGTFHSFGLNLWRKVAQGAEVAGDKTEAILEDIDTPRAQRAFIQFMVGIAKQSGFGIGELGRVNDWYEAADWYDAWEKLGEEPTEEQKEQALEAAAHVLQLSCERAYDTIDFDDMLYMPLKQGIVNARYDWVLVDEAQDTNVLRRLLARAMLKPKGRLLFVGDEHQAIYGFSGASADAMDLIEQDFGCTRLPLTITYRCPKLIVSRAHEWVHHIQAADSAPDGVVRKLSNTDLHKLEPIYLDKRSVMLCRNTRPLVEEALRLIRRQIPCRVEGKEIGAGLVRLAMRWKSARSLSALRDKLDDYLFNETQRLLDKGQRAKVAALEDRVTSLQALIDSMKPEQSIWNLKATIERLFGDSEGGKEQVFTLSTIHKAKGREWDRVYWLNPDLWQPSKWAKQDWEKQQERNLCYVAVTRAKQELVEILAGVPV